MNLIKEYLLGLAMHIYNSEQHHTFSDSGCLFSTNFLSYPVLTYHICGPKIWYSLGILRNSAYFLIDMSPLSSGRLPSLWPRGICKRLWWFMNSLAKLVCYLLGVIPVQFATRYRVISPWKKGPRFCRRYFQMHFREWNVLSFDINFHWSFCLRVQLTITQHWFRWWLGAE